MQPTRTYPREGMMAVVRQRRAMITAVDAAPGDERGEFHLVDVEYTDGLGAETDRLLWEVEPDTEVVEPSALPRVGETAPMDPLEFDAMVRAARWSALTPSLPFSGLDQDRPPVAAPLFGAIHPEPYQLVPVLRALQMPRVALMLADAVGLGKTIQAGMVLRELMLRRRIRRVLILCPASLRTQWRDEMEEKFSLPFEIVDRPQTLKLQREIGLDANPWKTHERIIASYHYAKQPDVLEQLRVTAEPDEDGRLRWDLLIVDEAHNLAPASFGPDSDLSRMLQAIAPWFEHRVFLTATPHNGHTRSFSGLLETLDPVRFTRKAPLDDEDRKRVAETVIRRLKSEINDAYRSVGQPAHFADRTVEALPGLHFGKAERALHDAFRDFRRALKKAATGAGNSDQMASSFAIEVLQKRLLSGPWPFGQSWLAVVEGLKDPEAAGDVAGRARAVRSDDVDDDNERDSRQRLADRTVGAWLRKWQSSVSAEIDAVGEALVAVGVTQVRRGLDPADHVSAVAKASAKVSGDARLRALELLIDAKLRQGDAWRRDDRIVVFTEYLATLHYLRARLQARYGEGPWLLTLFGGMRDVERDAVKDAFNDARAPARVLLATDAAGEGLNLQRSCRLLLHWDIPWNPGKMEQRNGRLDRHGQERDVTIFHFDSADDESMRFLGRLMTKRSQTREDRVVTDELFADAIVAHFEQDESPTRVAETLERTLAAARAKAKEIEADLPDGAVLPGQDDDDRLKSLRADLDISPATLRETLETAMAIDAGRPRLKADRPGRDYFQRPIPALWQELVTDALSKGREGALPALVFDPAHFVQLRGNDRNRPVYIPEPDARLMHLGHALYHRVLSTFARFRFPGGPNPATRWTTRIGGVPDGADALVLLTVEELAINALREACHHWVRTFAFPVHCGTLGDGVPGKPAHWPTTGARGDKKRAAAVWDDIDVDLEERVRAMQRTRTAEIRASLEASGLAVINAERSRFALRRAELTRAINDTGATVRAEAAVKREALAALRVQPELWFSNREAVLRREIADMEAEILLQGGHYTTVRDALDRERKRVMEQVLPKRYKLDGEARVYPIAVEIRLPGGPS